MSIHKPGLSQWSDSAGPGRAGVVMVVSAARWFCSVAATRSHVCEEELSMFFAVSLSTA